MEHSVSGATSRTDTVVIRGDGGSFSTASEYVHADHARQLERELAECRAKSKRWMEIADKRAIEVADLKTSLSAGRESQRDALPGGVQMETEGYPGIAHDLESLRNALELHAEAVYAILCSDAGGDIPARIAAAQEHVTTWRAALKNAAPSSTEGTVGQSEPDAVVISEGMDHRALIDRMTPCPVGTKLYKTPQSATPQIMQIIAECPRNEFASLVHDRHAREVQAWVGRLLNAATGRTNEILEGRRSPPAGALGSGSPTTAALDANPGGAVPGGVVCPHAAPFVYCEKCKVDPCPMGLSDDCGGSGNRYKWSRG